MYMDTKEFRRQIAEKFIDSLKENPEHWQRQWSVSGGRPENCVSHTVYSGINRFNLTFAAIQKGSDDMRWATFKQIQQQGWHLKKGARAEMVEFWQPYDKYTHKVVPWDEYNNAENPENYGLRSRYHMVFNAKDIEGIPPEVKVHNNITQNEAIDRVIDGMAIKVLNDSPDKAYYSVTNDDIHLPRKEVFDNDHAYNSTLLHELSHATGAKNRLDRVQSGIRSTSDYAVEELVAEISSCFTGADIGLQYEPAEFKNHKAYVQSWISAIEQKQEVLFEAIRQADRAADYLLEKGGLLKVNETENENVEEVMENSTQSVDSMRTPETIVINNELEIVELTGNLKFKNSVGYTMPEGYCFMHPDKGYLAFAGNTMPYMPLGGKNALLNIQKDGGFLNFDDMAWVKPVEEPVAVHKSVEEKEKVGDKINEYIECMVKNNDISSTKNFYKYLDEKRENLADLLKWRSLGGTMLNEKLPEGYEQACFGLLKEFMPEKVNDFELSKECYKAFKKDVEVNGYQPTAYLMSNYYYMMEKMGRETPAALSEISKEYLEGSSDPLVNNIGNELKAQENLQLQEMEQCR